MPRKPAANVARTTLPLSQLRDEKNIRRELRIEDGWLVASIRENGIVSPLVVEPAPDAPELFDVVQGKRRLAAAREAGVTEAPVYVLDPAQRTAGLSYIEMLVENDADGRKALSALEQADALFQAVEAGMEPAAAARRAGRSDDHMAQALATARKVTDRTRRALAGTDGYEWDLATLAVLAEFDDDEEAVTRLVAAQEKGMFSHQATAERDARQAREARDAVREECRANGVRLIESEELDAFECLEVLDYLWDDAGGKLSNDVEGHATCEGHALIWDDDSDTPDTVIAACVDPDQYKHLGYDPSQVVEEPEESQEEPQGAASSPRTAKVTEEPAAPASGPREGMEDDEEDDTPPPAPAPRPAPVVKPEPDGMERKLKLAGNAAYRAAMKTRRAWLKDTFLQRKTAPPSLPGWVTTQWLKARKPVQMWTGEISRASLVAELLGEDKRAEDRTTWAPAGATPGKLTLINFAIIAGCYEKRLDEVQTWRKDKPSWDTNEIRDDARVYLSYLATIGYTLSLVEQAIVDDVEFNGLLAGGQEQAPEGPSGEPQKDTAQDTEASTPDETAESEQRADSPDHDGGEPSDADTVKPQSAAQDADAAEPPEDEDSDGPCSSQRTFVSFM